MIQVRAVELRRLALCTRLPFRYGIATMTTVPHLFVNVALSDGAEVTTGLAADHLPPRWFRKEPGLSLAAEIDEMLDVVNSAAAAAVEIGPAPTVWQWWQQLWRQQELTAARRGWPDLLAHFGTSLIERAVVDAYARLRRQPWAACLRDMFNEVDLGVLDPALAGQTLQEVLPAQPLSRATVRHTVGLVDPLTESEIEERPNDGLPISLEAAIAHYGLHDFKLKLCGERSADLNRLRRISEVVTAGTGGRFAFSLDGNEQFQQVEQVRQLASAIAREPELRRFFEHLLFVEQPFARGVALHDGLGDVRAAWTGVPIIIDESDGGLGDLPQALARGYAGVSHKNCKGLFKGLRNAALVAQRRRAEPDMVWVTSGEDLANVGPVALLQDLAMQALLGNASVERNGHHYFAGLSAFPREWVAEVVAAHPDLYAADERLGATLRVRQGEVNLGTVNAAPFGCGFALPRRSQLGELAGYWGKPFHDAQ